MCLRRKALQHLVVVDDAHQPLARQPCQRAVVEAAPVAQPAPVEADGDGVHASGPAYEGSVGLIVRLFAEDADELRLSPEEFAHVVRMLAFGGCHRHISRDRPLTPEQVTDLLLDGALRRPDTLPDLSTHSTVESPTEPKDASC